MPNDNFEDLDDLQPDWLDADDNMGASVPDGIYQVRINKLSLTRTQQVGLPMVAWEMEVIGPQHEGRKMFDNQVIRGDTKDERLRSLGFVKSRLKMLGDVPANLKDLADENVRMQYLDKTVEVQQKTTVKADKEYTNIYFRKLLELNGSSETGRGF